MWINGTHAHWPNVLLETISEAESLPFSDGTSVLISVAEATLTLLKMSVHHLIMVGVKKASVPWRRRRCEKSAIG